MKIISIKDNNENLYPVSLDKAIYDKDNNILSNKKNNSDVIFNLSDINHIIGAGQSLGTGTGSSACITKNTFGDSELIFDSGSAYTSIETIPTSFSENTYSGIQTPNEEAAHSFMAISGCATHGKKILSTNCSIGGSVIESWLKESNTNYNLIINSIQHGYNIAKNNKQSYKVLAILWTQGEHNGDTPDYLDKLISLRNSLISDIESITGDDYSNLKFIMYQCTTVSYHVSLAFYNATKINKNFICAIPMYCIPKYIDGFHCSVESYFMIGACYGYSLYRAMMGLNNPLIPQKSIIDNINKYIDLIFSVPLGKLVFDYPYIDSSSYYQFNKTLTNYGFYVGNGISNYLNSIEIINDNTLRFYVSDIVDNMYISSGQQDSVTNTPTSNAMYTVALRDTQGDSIKFIKDNIIYRIDNWCPLFKFNIN